LLKKIFYIGVLEMLKKKKWSDTLKCFKSDLEWAVQEQEEQNKIRSKSASDGVGLQTPGSYRRCTQTTLLSDVWLDRKTTHHQTSPAAGHEHFRENVLKRLTFMVSCNIISLP
jgi:hypothetical protein